MSIRNYERRFVAEMGISPKLFARVARFQRALDRKRITGETWLEVAQEIGYSDQMHMVRDFRAFGGEPPSRLIQTSGDFQPWSIDCPSKR
jgi:transcriptional regulator GlxA family with amidase domain